MSRIREDEEFQIRKFVRSTVDSTRKAAASYDGESRIEIAHEYYDVAEVARDITFVVAANLLTQRNCQKAGLWNIRPSAMK